MSSLPCTSLLPTRQTSMFSIRRCRSMRYWPMSMATPSSAPKPWFCGKRNLETSQLALKRSSMSLFLPRKQSGDSVLPWSCSCRTAKRGKVQTIHLHESSDTCSLPQKTTCGSFSPLLRRITSTCCALRPTSGLVSLSSLSLRSSFCVCMLPHRVSRNSLLAPSLPCTARSIRGWKQTACHE